MEKVTKKPENRWLIFLYHLKTKYWIVITILFPIGLFFFFNWKSKVTNQTVDDFLDLMYSFIKDMGSLVVTMIGWFYIANKERNKEYRTAKQKCYSKCLKKLFFARNDACCDRIDPNDINNLQADLAEMDMFGSKMVINSYNNFLKSLYELSESHISNKHKTPDLETKMEAAYNDLVSKLRYDINLYPIGDSQEIIDNESFRDNTE